MRWILVLVGGGVGSLARYLTSTWMAGRFGAGFPWGTLTVNVAGAFVIGVVATLADDYGRIGPQARTLIVVGVLGGFTTFSSFSLETFRLGQDGELVSTLLNVVANVALSLIAVVIGVAAARGLER